MASYATRTNLEGAEAPSLAQCFSLSLGHLCASGASREAVSCVNDQRELCASSALGVRTANLVRLFCVEDAGAAGQRRRGRAGAGCQAGVALAGSAGDDSLVMSAGDHLRFGRAFTGLQL